MTKKVKEFNGYFYLIKSTYLVHLSGLPAVGNGASVVLVGTMREVHPGHVHAILNELKKSLRGTTNWANSADNTAQTHPKEILGLKREYFK